LQQFQAGATAISIAAQSTILCLSDQAAEVLDFTEENVKVRLHRARALLRKSLYESAGMERKQAFNFHAVRCDRVVKNVFERIQKRASKTEKSALKVQ
jgi:hypothetical protein